MTHEVRQRGNLDIVTSALVTNLVFEGKRVVGAQIEKDGARSVTRAHRVIVSAGAIHSPALLLRSGVGPEQHLLEKGIEPVVNLEGVGKNLQNHSYLFYALTLPRGKRLASHLRRFAVAGLRASSKLPDCPDSDLLLFALGRVSPSSFGTYVAMVGSALYSPFSTGVVTLNSRDPQVSPNVEFRMLNDARDAPRVIQGARLVEQLLAHPQVAASYGDAFLLPTGMAVNQFNRPGLAGVLLAAGANIVLNGPRPIRRYAVSKAFRAGPSLSQRAGGRYTDDEILRSIAPMGHPVGTCAMGDIKDPGSVVDSGYRVKGVENLYVVDASIMPVIPSANTNLPTLMLAEHAAERMSNDIA